MAFFDIDEEMVASVIESALEEAGAQASVDQMNKIIDAIDDSFPGIVELLTYGTQQNWQSEAEDVSSGWGSKYASAIKANVSGNNGEVYVDESMTDKQSNKPIMLFVNMVENGMKSFSIKDALMRSDKAKTSAEGIKYMSIPFPVRAPSNPTQGKSASKFGDREMSQEAHKIVKSGGRYSGPLKSGQEVSGLTKYVTQQRHEQYGIFITVSEKSKGWIHPGVLAEPVFAKILAEVNKQVSEVLQEYCKSIVKEFTK